MPAILIVLLVCLALILLMPAVLHHVYRAPRIREQTTPAKLGIPFQQHWIETVRNKRLFAWYLPVENSCLSLVICHGWGGNAEMMLPLAQPFHDAGFNVWLYDARNHGQSDGDNFSSLPRFAEDLECVLDWHQQQNPNHTVVALGHSVGAAAVILSASRGAKIDLAISVSGFAHPRLMMNRHLNKWWLPKFMRITIIEYIQWVIGFRFNDIAPMNRIQHVHCPVLLAHGTNDQVVPIEDMHRIVNEASPDQNIKILAVEGATHDSVEHFKRHAKALMEWVQTYYPPNRPQ